MTIAHLLLSGLLAAFGLLGCDKASNSHQQSPANLEGNDKKNRKSELVSHAVTVQEKWDMPAVLKEVSGIAYINQDRFACIQDEAGIIFIYNTTTARIEKEIPFAGAGDYEGIALTGKTAYVVRSDGKLFEVTNIESESPQVKQYTTPLTVEHNIEGLCYDQQHTRLLLSIKDSEPGSADFKGIYAFDLNTKKLISEPVYRINLNDPAFKEVDAKKKKAVIQPSEINIHPKTGDIYLTEATKPKLLVLHPDGKIKALYQLSNTDFPQPEGLAFSPAGELFIANEGKKESGTVLKVKIEEQ